MWVDYGKTVKREAYHQIVESIQLESNSGRMGFSARTIIDIQGEVTAAAGHIAHPCQSSETKYGF